MMYQYGMNTDIMVHTDKWFEHQLFIVEALMAMPREKIKGLIFNMRKNDFVQTKNKFKQKGFLRIRFPKYYSLPLITDRQ